MQRKAILGAVCVLLGACSLIVGPDQKRWMGSIGYPDNLSISVPDTVAAGQPFQVTVRTFGPDMCWGEDETEVELTAGGAVVTPYDVQYHGNCLQMPVEISHAAALTFERIGNARISVRGRDGSADYWVVVR